MSSTSIYEWYSRYYYILQNKTSEKLYVGQTSQNIENYLGSGSYWTNHCKKHGGYNKDNIKLVWYKFFNYPEHAQMFLDDLEYYNPEYWNSDMWANLIKETTEDCPLKNNQHLIFEKYGNPFTGGKIQKEARARGCYDNVDYQKLGYKSWENSDPNRRSETADRMRKTTKEWIKNNYDRFVDLQSQKGNKARESTAYKLSYNGKVYYSFSELKRETGITKERFLKHSLGEVLQEPTRGKNKGNI